MLHVFIKFILFTPKVVDNVKVNSYFNRSFQYIQKVTLIQTQGHDRSDY